jgi:hypothetical protein
MAGQLASPRVRRTTIAAAGLLAAAAIAWAALPLLPGHPAAPIALAAAIGTAVLSVGRLALGDIERSTAGFRTTMDRILDRLLRYLTAAQWPELMLVAVLILEALHPARPWHTALLGLALLAFLFAVHLAETRAEPAVLRGQLPLIAAGVGLMALSVGAAALPGVAVTAVSLLAGAGTVLVAVVIGVLLRPGTRSARR